MLSKTNEREDWHNSTIGRANLIAFFAALLAASFLLRIFYSGHLYQDDGAWFTAGEEILRGKALYREVYFDKPPALPLVYALAFWAFGAHIFVIRLLTIFYVVAVSAVLFCFGSRLYDRRTGMLGAALFTVLSTTSVNNHQQGFNTDLLMILPYAASAYLFVRACLERRASMAFIGGVLTGLAVQANPKGGFALVFFATLLVVARKWPVNGGGSEQSLTREAWNNREPSFRGGASFGLFICALFGFVAGTAPFLIYILAHRSFSYYWRDVWDWGSRYASYFSIWRMAGRGLWLTSAFFLRNNTLTFGFAFVVMVVVRSVLKKSTSLAGNAPRDAGLGFNVFTPARRSDVTLLLWFLVSYAALAVGGRFYSQYFVQILPGLCLLGARGLLDIHATLKDSRPNFRRLAILVIGVGFIVTLIQFHTRTVVLAIDWIRGARSASTSNWYHDRLRQSEIMAAAAVRDMPDFVAKMGAFGAEALRADSPRIRGATEASDYLFVWGYRPEIYYWSGLLPASRYLSSQPLTGVPADIHHDSASRPVLDASLTAAARAELVADLKNTQPKYILDELGFFNADLAMGSYPELQEFLQDYKNDGPLGSFIIYRKKERRKMRAQ